jgi:hypothetical protein
VNFFDWKTQLQTDAERTERARLLSCLEDYVLRIFWRDGVPPTCQDIIDGASRRKKPPASILLQGAARRAGTLLTIK